jgi:3-hydroxyisobutyryl-CoA hydrolase
VVLQGAGTKAFCAGGDVVAIVKDEPKGSRQKFFYDEYQADHFVATLKQPHIALWQGIVMGVDGRQRAARRLPAERTAIIGLASSRC